MDRFRIFGGLGLPALLSIALSACGGATPSSGGLSPADPAPPPATAPPTMLPFPAGRAAGVSLAPFQQGKDAIQRSARTQVFGSDLQLTALDNETQWAIYRFDLAAQTLPDSLTIQLDPLGTDEVWFGLADYSTGRWSLRGPFTAAQAGQPLALSANPYDAADLRYISPGNSVYLGILVASDHACLVNNLNLTTRTKPSPPVIVSLYPMPPNGAPGDPLSLESAAQDPDNDIVSYDWDLDGDGTFETPGGLNSAMPTTFPAAGTTVTVNLRVTDSTGLSATFGRSLTSTAVTGQRQKVADGGPCSFTVVSGSPAFAYYSPGGWYFIRATTPAGTAWGTPVLLAASTSSGEVSLAMVGGKPAVAYQASAGLRFVSAMDATGSTWNQSVDIPGGGGQDLVLAEVNAKPAIAFYIPPGDWGLPSFIHYLHATDAAGTLWGSVQSPEPRTDINRRPALAVVNGRPALCYSRSDGVCYLRATDAAGDSWGTPLLLVPGGFSPSLCVVNGFPAVCCNYGGLAFIRSIDADGTAWGSPVTIDASSAPLWLSLTMVNGRPAVGYFEGSQHLLSYIAASDSSGAGWGAPETLDITYSNDPYHLALAEVNGGPAIGYDYTGAMPQVRYVSGF